MAEIPKPSAKEIDLGKLVTFGNESMGVPATKIYVRNPEKYSLDNKPITEVTLKSGDELEETGENSARVRMWQFPEKPENTRYQTTILRTHPNPGEEIPWKSIGGIRLMDSQGIAIDIPKEDLQLEKPTPLRTAAEIALAGEQPEKTPYQPNKRTGVLVGETPAPTTTTTEAVKPPITETPAEKQAEITAPSTAKSAVETEAAQMQPTERYPRYVDTSEVTKEELDADPHFQEILSKARDVIEEIRRSRGDLDQINLIPQIAEQIREVGKYSDPANINNAQYQALLKSLQDHGIENHDEFLSATDYLLDESRRTHNEGEIGKFQAKYGKEASRTSILDMVQRHEGTIQFSQDAVEMNMTAEDRNAGYQDLRAVQLVGDYLLDTYDPQARTTWVKDGKLTPEGIKLQQEYNALLLQMMKGEVPADKQELAARLMEKYKEFKKLSVDQGVDSYKGLIPGDKDRMIKSVDRWRTKHHIEPYRPGDLDLLLTKGLSLGPRRADDYPKNLESTTSVFHRKALQEKPREGAVKKPEVVTEGEKLPTAEELGKPPTVVHEEEKPLTKAEEVKPGEVQPEAGKPATIEAAGKPTLESEKPKEAEIEVAKESKKPEIVGEKPPQLDTLQSTITIVGYDALEARARDLGRMQMEETQVPPGFFPLMMMRSRQAGQAGANIFGRTSAELKAVGEWFTNLNKKGVVEHFRTASRNFFKNNIWKEWYTEQYRQQETKELKSAGTHLANESLDIARNRARQEILGDKYWTGGELKFGGRLWERIKSPIMGSERAVFKRTLKILDEMRANGQITELAAHEKTNEALLDRFTQEHDRLIHRDAGEDFTLLDKPEDKATVDGIRDLIKKYLRGETGFATRQEFQDKFYEHMHHNFPTGAPQNWRKMGECDFYATTLFESAQAVQQRIVLDMQADSTRNQDDVINGYVDKLNIKLGIAKVAQRTANEKTVAEKILAKFDKFPLTTFINEASIGTTVAAAISTVMMHYPVISLRSFATKWSNLVLPVLGGATAGGVYRGVLERARLGQEIYQHRREREAGLTYSQDSPNRSWLEQFMIPQRQAQDLGKDLTQAFYEDPTDPNSSLKQFANAEDLRKTVAVLADVNARVAISDRPTQKDALIAYSSLANIDPERTALDLLRDRIQQQLVAFGQNAANQTIISEATGGASLETFLGNVTDLQQLQFNQGHEKVIEVVNRGLATVQEQAAVEQTPVAKGLETIEKEFKREAFEKSVVEAAKMAVAGIVIGEVFTETAAGFDALKHFITKDQTPHALSPLQHLIFGQQAVQPPPGGGAMSQQMVELSKVHLPAGTELRDVDNDGIKDLVKSDGTILARDVINADGTLTPDAASELAKAHINLVPPKDIPAFQGPAHTETIDGGHKLVLPQGVDVGAADADGLRNDLTLHMPNGPTVLMHNALNPDGTLTQQAQLELQANHFNVGATSSETIIGAGIQTPASLGEVAGAPGNLAQIRLPDGMNVHMNAAGQVDGLTVAATGATIPMIVDATGHIHFDANATQQFEAAGIHNFDPNTDVNVTHQAVQIGTDTKSGWPDHQITNHQVVNVHRQGWWDNKTPAEFDKNGNVIDYHSDKSELDTWLYAQKDGTIVVRETFRNPITTATALPGELNIPETARMDHLTFQAVLPDGRTVQFGAFNKNGFLFLDGKDSDIQQIFKVDSTKVTPQVPFIEVVRNMGKNPDGSINIQPVASNKYDAPSITIPKFAEIPTTTLNVGPATHITTPIEFTGHPQELTLTPQPEVREELLTAAVLPILGRSPLEREMSNENVLILYGYGGNSTEGLGWIDRSEYTSRRSKTLIENPNAKLDESAEVADYLSRINPQYREELEQMDRLIGKPMSSETRTVITVPVFGEGKIIRQTLEQFLNQKDRNGDSINPNLFEIIVFENDTDARPKDETENEIKKFKTDHPDFKVHYAYRRWNHEDISNRVNTVGNGRRYNCDLALLRSSKRTTNAGELIIINNDADLEGITPTYVTDIIEEFDTNESRDAIIGKRDLPDWALKKPNIKAGQRLWETFDAVMRHTGGGGEMAPDQRRKGWPGLIGENSAMRASIYAAVGGYGPKAKLAEDQNLGDMMRVARNYDDSRFKYINRLQTIKNPRRYLTCMVEGKPMIEMYNDYHENKNIRDLDNNQLLDRIPDTFDITRFQLDADAIYQKKNTYQHLKGYEFDQRFKKMMGFMGTEYVIENGHVKITDASKLISGLQENSTINVPTTRPPVIQTVPSPATAVDLKSSINVPASVEPAPQTSEPVRVDISETHADFELPNPNHATTSEDAHEHREITQNGQKIDRWILVDGSGGSIPQDDPQRSEKVRTAALTMASAINDTSLATPKAVLVKADDLGRPVPGYGTAIAADFNPNTGEVHLAHFGDSAALRWSPTQYASKRFYDPTSTPGNIQLITEQHNLAELNRKAKRGQTIDLESPASSIIYRNLGDDKNSRQKVEQGIVETNLTLRDDEYLLLVTDGARVGDMLTDGGPLQTQVNTIINQLYTKQITIEEATRQIAETAKNRAAEAGGDYDDITIVILRRQPNP